MPGAGLAFLAPAATGGTWYPQRFFAPLERNEPWLSSALNVIDRLVAEVQAAGVAAEHIGLAGFSQGGCLVLEYASRHPRRYWFVAGLSGALIGPAGTPRPPVDLRGTPVLLGCAERDAHIPRSYVEGSAETLAQFGAVVTKQIFPGAAHMVFPEEIEWLRQQVSDTGPQAIR
jgi:predicted esterase